MSAENLHDTTYSGFKEKTYGRFVNPVSIIKDLPYYLDHDLGPGKGRRIMKAIAAAFILPLSILGAGLLTGESLVTFSGAYFTFCEGATLVGSWIIGGRGLRQELDKAKANPKLPSF